jgi:hypothetical protein
VRVITNDSKNAAFALIKDINAVMHQTFYLLLNLCLNGVSYISNFALGIKLNLA